jgi:glutathione S-transferase
MGRKIHAFPLSPRSFKVLLVANHLGLDYEYCFCDLRKGAQKDAAYTAINLNQKAPALEDSDFKLWESNAIIQYLASKKPGELSPLDDKGRADVLRWQFWESTTWDSALAVLAFERVVKGLFGMGPPNQPEVEKGLAKFSAAANVLNTHLRGRDYVAGDRLSLADFSIAAGLVLAGPAQLPLNSYTEVERWGERMSAIPAWAATLAMQQTSAAA